MVFLKTLKFYKVVQDTNPLARVLKENADYFAEYIWLQINVAITVRSVQIQTFSGRNFPVIRQNTRKYRPAKACIWALFMQRIGSSKFLASSKFAKVTLVFKQCSGNQRED